LRVGGIFWKQVEGVSDFQSIGGVRRRTHSLVNLQLELVRERPTTAISIPSIKIIIYLTGHSLLFIYCKELCSPLKYFQIHQNSTVWLRISKRFLTFNILITLCNKRAKHTYRQFYSIPYIFSNMTFVCYSVEHIYPGVSIRLY